MTLRTWLVVAVFAFNLLASSVAGGQTFTVRVDGSGDFNDLQVAVSSVPAGAIVVVYPKEIDNGYGYYENYEWGPVSCDKSISIIGLAGIYGDFPIIGSNPATSPPLTTLNGYPTAMWIDAGPSDVVRLKNLVIRNGLLGPSGIMTHGIVAESVGVLYISSCEVIATRNPDGQPVGYDSAPAHAIVVSGSAKRVVVQNSLVVGAGGTTQSNVGDDGSFSHGDGIVIGGTGGDSVHAPLAEIVLIDRSELTAGNGGYADYRDEDWSSDFVDPILVRGGDAGNAVTGEAFIFESDLLAGVPGGYSDWGEVSGPGAIGAEVVGHRVGVLGIERISTDSTGVEGNNDSGGSQRLGISADGTVVAFLSNASNLVAGDLNGVQDVFVRDQLRGTTTRVSLDSSGSEADNRTENISLSGDGNVIAFSSSAINLVAGDLNQRFDVFVHNRSTGITERVSVGPGGVEGNEWSGTTGTSVSYDGRFIAFDSDATNLVTSDTNGSVDVFVRDRMLGTTERVSVSSDGSQGTYGGYGPRLSSDGRYVAFTSDSPDLVVGDTNGITDIFVHDRQAGTTERVSLPSGVGEANGRSFTSAISDDGRWVTFDSDAYNLVANDTNGVLDVFARDRLTGITVRASVASDGTEANDISVYPVISGDGKYISYVSPANNLVPDDIGSTDIFRYDLTTGRTSRQSVADRNTAANGTSQSPAINADGQWIAFQSFSSWLIEGDTNGVPDVFLRGAHCVDAAWWNYGVGFPGTLGTPTLTLQVDPLLGTPLSVDLSNSYGQSTVGVVLIGFQDIFLPTKKSGTYLVLPLVSVALTVPASGVAIDTDLDDDDALSGLHIYVQALQVDPGAVRGISFTPGLDLLLGR